MSTNFVKANTLTKKELLLALDGVDDDARIYVTATKSVIEMAQSGALIAPHDVYLALSKNVQFENDGVSLVADF